MSEGLGSVPGLRTCSTKSMSSAVNCTLQLGRMTFIGAQWTGVYLLETLV